MRVIKQLPLVLVCTAALALGCVSAGLKRTPLDQWAYRKFGNVGIELEMPKKEQFVEITGLKSKNDNKEHWRTLSIRFHSLSSGIFMAEPIYLVYFRFERLSVQQYQTFQKGQHVLAYYWLWKDHHEREYTNTVRFAWQDMRLNGYGWRRDYRCPNGDVVVAGVEQFRVGQDEVFFVRDTDAIERVLNSVRVFDCAEE